MWLYKCWTNQLLKTKIAVFGKCILLYWAFYLRWILLLTLVLFERGSSATHNPYHGQVVQSIVAFQAKLNSIVMFCKAIWAALLSMHIGLPCWVAISMFTISACITVAKWFSASAPVNPVQPRFRQFIPKICIIHVMLQKL